MSTCVMVRVPVCSVPVLYHELLRKCVKNPEEEQKEREKKTERRDYP